MIVIRRVYTPSPGAGGRLLTELKQVNKATIEAGFPALQILRRSFGPHGTLVTMQTWPSSADYEASREQVRQTRAITEVFERIYGLLALTHVTEMYELVAE